MRQSVLERSISSSMPSAIVTQQFYQHEDEFLALASDGQAQSSINALHSVMACKI